MDLDKLINRIFCDRPKFRHVKEMKCGVVNELFDGLVGSWVVKVGFTAHAALAGKNPDIAYHDEVRTPDRVGLGRAVF